MAVNWQSNSALAGFQNALALGADIGGAIRQKREDSALAAFMTANGPQTGIVATPAQEAETARMEKAFPNAPNAQGEAYARLMKINPALAMKAGSYINEQKATQAKLLKEQNAAALRQKAAQGDPQALQQLIGIDFDAWKAFDSNKKKLIEEQTKYTGQEALRISQLPQGQQAAEWDHAIEQGVKLGYTGLGDHKGKFSPQALNAAISNAGLVEKFISLAEPKYQVVPGDADLVNTRDPAALAKFGGLRGNAPSTQAFPVNSKAEYDALPPGSEYIAPDGSVKRKGGGVSNGTGGFR